MESNLITIIDIASSSKIENTSTSERGGSSTGIISTGVMSGVIYTGVITICHICVGGGDGDDIANAKDADDSIVSSSPSSYWGKDQQANQVGYPPMTCGVC